MTAPLETPHFADEYEVIVYYMPRRSSHPLISAEDFQMKVYNGNRSNPFNAWFLLESRS